MCSDAPPPPDYTPVANASEEAARIAAEQSDRVLAENKRQYDLNMATAKPVIDAQLQTMAETNRQGKDYYDYMVANQRPVEAALNADAMGLNADDISRINAVRAEEEAAYQAKMAAARARYEAAVAQSQGSTPLIDTSGIKDVVVPEPIFAPAPGAGANVLSGTSLFGGAGFNRTKQQQIVTNQKEIDAANATNALNAQIRTALEKARVSGGASPLNFDDFSKGITRDSARSTALMQELSATAARRKQDERAAAAVADSQGGYTRSLNQAIRQARRYGVDSIAPVGSQIVQQAQNTAAAANNARRQEEALGYAKKLDVAGLYRGLPGASQGAYGVATQAGNSAVNNQMAPSAQYMNGVNSAANMVNQGQATKLQGLGNVLSAQTSAYNAGLSADDGLMGAVGMIGGAYVGSPAF